MTNAGDTSTHFRVSHRPEVSPSPHLTETDYHDGLVPGVIYACNGGSVERYLPKKCWSHGGACSPSCELFENGKCEMSRLNRSTDSHYRIIDNMPDIPNSKNQSSPIHPEVEQSPERETLVEDGVQQEGVVASQSMTPILTPNKIQWSVDDVEKTIDEM